MVPPVVTAWVTCESVCKGNSTIEKLLKIGGREIMAHFPLLTSHLQNLPGQALATKEIENFYEVVDNQVEATLFCLSSVVFSYNGIPISEFQISRECCKAI